MSKKYEVHSIEDATKKDHVMYYVTFTKIFPQHVQVKAERLPLGGTTVVGKVKDTEYYLRRVA